MANNETTVSNSYLSSNPDFNVADDKIGTKRYQQIKLIDSTVGSTDPVGTAANPLHVQGSSVGGDVNIAEVGGVATSLGQKAEAASIPVVLATEQDTVDTDGTYGNFTKVGIPWSDSGDLSTGWKPWPVIGDGRSACTPAVVVKGKDSGSDATVPITVENVTPTVGGWFQTVRSILFGVDNTNTVRRIKTDTGGAVAVQDDGGSITIDAASLPLPAGAATEVTLAAVNTKLVGGTTIGDVRLRDGAGNVLVSSTTTPGTSDRGLVGRNINYNYDSGALAHFRAEGNSLYGTTYVTEKSATGVNKSFNTGNSDTGTQRVVLAANQPTVRDSSGNAVASATTTPGASDRGLTTRSFTYTHDADGAKITSGSSAVAYSGQGLAVRKPADVYIANSQEGALVAPQGYYFYTSRTTAAGSTTTVINTTTDPSTQVRRGDLLRVASGTHAEGIYQQSVVSSVTSSTITLQFPLTVAPPTTRTVNIYKPLSLVCDSQGRPFVQAYPATNFPTYPVYANKFFCDKGELAFGSISGSYATIATTVAQIAVIKIVNGTNVPLMFSFDGGSTDWDMLPAGQSATLPAIQNGGYVGGSTDIQVKDIGSAAGSGSAYYFGYYF